MSAYLDKSQGVTFVYSNIYQLYLKAKHSKLDDALPVEKVAIQSNKIIRESELKDSPVSAFKPREFPVPMGVQEAEAKALQKQMGSVKNLKQNLDNLKDAHAKLRFLLKELEDISKKD